MFDREQLQNQIKDARNALDLVNAQRERLDDSAAALMDFIEASETMLRVVSPSMTLFPTEEPKVEPKLLREHGLRAYIRDVLKEAEQPLDLREIWKRAKERGANTGTDDPENAVRYALYGMRRHGFPVHRTGQKQWMWADEKAVTE